MPFVWLAVLAVAVPPGWAPAEPPESASLLAPKDLHTLRAQMTLVGGRVVYEAK